MAEMGIFGFLSAENGLPVVIRGIGYGLVAAAFISFFITLTNRKIVKRLLESGAVSRDAAKSAKEAGIDGVVFRRALRDKSTLRKTVKATELKAEADGEEKRYYIPEENADAAEIRYVKKNSPVAWIVGTAALAVLTEGAVIAIPWILSLFK